MLSSGKGGIKVNEEDLKECKSEVKNLRDTFTPGQKKRKLAKTAGGADVQHLLKYLFL